MTSKMVKAEAEKQKDLDSPVFIKEVTFTHAGEEYTVRGDALDDVEILELLEDEQYIKALRRMVGLDNWNRFKESVRTDDGRVPAKELESFLQRVMEELDPTSAS